MCERLYRGNLAIYYLFWLNNLFPLFQVWDWRDDKWVSIAKKCGRNIPTDIQSTGDKLKILFRSNNKTTARGFKVS